MAHYFSASPDSADARREIAVTLAGRTVDVYTSGGVFSPGRLDLGTAQLLRAGADLPETGTFVDVGCGWGPIALDMALARPGANVWAVDVNERARELTAANAERLGCRVRVADPGQALAALESIDVLRSNPPIRIGKGALHELLATWLPRLAPDGYGELVVSKNLGADSLARWISAELSLACERIASRKGYRILRVSRDGADI
ncbi:MAG: methyltransferase [Bowdeniella nasicola]|nr:methyltransferase [Bowdeniella nasicola]